MNDHQTLASDQNTTTVAVVTFDALGDGLVFLILAENLKRNGYAVTFYSNAIHQMKAWLPGLTIKPFPDLQDVGNEFRAYDLVIGDAGSVLTKQASPDEYAALARQYILVSTKKIDSRLLADHSERIIRDFPEGKRKKLLRLANSGGPIRDQSKDDRTMVGHMVSFCQKKMGLEDVTAAVSWSAPSPLAYRKYPKRVAIFPYSGEPKKNWSPQQFLRFAGLLEKSAWQPCFVVEPRERNSWRLRLQGRFSLPELNDIHDLASLIYESAVVVANDSGGGHLASLLNIPALTIFKKNNNVFSCRPGWHEGKVIRPLLTVKLLGKRIWRPFLPAFRVHRAFNDLIRH